MFKKKVFRLLVDVSFVKKGFNGNAQESLNTFQGLCQEKSLKVTPFFYKPKYFDNIIINIFLAIKDSLSQKSIPFKKNITKQYIIPRSYISLKIYILLSHLFNPVKINFKHYDCILFNGPLPNITKVPSQVLKLIRYHDLIPVTHPHLMQNGVFHTRYHLDALTNMHSDKNTHLVCVSPITASNLIKYFPDWQSRVHVIGNIVQLEKPINKCNLSKTLPQYFSTITKNEPEPYNLVKKIKKKKFLLHVSNLEPKKNHLELLKALNYLHKNGTKIPLILVGSKGWKNKKEKHLIKQFASEGMLLHLEKVPPKLLSYLYHQAGLFIFPSIAEGFGLPPAEAQLAGCPVVASNIPVLKWVLGNGAEWFDPYDYKQMASKIEKVYFNHSLQKTLIKKGSFNIKRFSDKKLMREWVRLMNEIKI